MEITVRIYDQEIIYKFEVPAYPVCRSKCQRTWEGCGSRHFYFASLQCRNFEGRKSQLRSHCSLAAITD